MKMEPKRWLSRAELQFIFQLLDPIKENIWRRQFTPTANFNKVFCCSCRLAQRHIRLLNKVPGAKVIFIIDVGERRYLINTTDGGEKKKWPSPGRLSGGRSSRHVLPGHLVLIIGYMRLVGEACFAHNYGDMRSATRNGTADISCDEDKWLTGNRFACDV